MNRFVRIVLLYLLALALPVQGWAAATQSACPPEMHQTAMQAAHEESIVESVAATSHEHEHHQMHAAHHQTDSSGDHHDQTAKTGHGNASCSACAACYIGMALLPAMPDLVKPAYGSAAVSVATPSIFLGHIPDGIKRPPRHILA